MSVIGLHPEDLLDRDARGELTPVESERLERHLTQCTTCQLERTVRSDFRVEEDPLGPDFDVQRLLSEVLAPGAERELLRPAERRRRPVGRGLRPLLLAAAALLVAGVSAAAGWKGVGVFGGRPKEVAHFVDAPTQANDPIAASHAPHTNDPRASIAPQPPALETTLAPPATEPVALATPATLVPATPLALSSPPAVARPLVTAPNTIGASAAAAPIAPSEVAAMFEHANRARRSGDHARATELYRSLLQRYPGSPEAHESEAVLGRELLGDGEATGALLHFDAYLRGGGALQEDVMADRALALGRLGRPRDEADAWGALLRAYPASVHASRATLRLRELGL
jgi:hypothetical protein